MKAHKLAPLLRLRQHRVDAAERSLAQAALRCTVQVAQRDDLGAILDQAEEGRLKQDALLSSVGAAGPAALHELLPLIALRHSWSRDCREHRRRLQDAVDACTSSDKERQALAVEHRHLHQAALKLDYILRQQMEKQQRGHNLAAECAAEEDFRALRSKPQMRPLDDA